MGQYAFIDSRFNTGPLAHTLTFGYFGDSYGQRSDVNANSSASVTNSNFNLLSPYYVDEPAFSAIGTTPYHRTNRF
jgi:hypothetical protein